MISPTHVHSTPTHSGFKCHRYISCHHDDIWHIIVTLDCSNMYWPGIDVWLYGLIQQRNVKSCKTFKCLQFFFHQLVLPGTHALHLRFYSSKVVIQFRFHFAYLHKVSFSSCFHHFHKKWKKNIQYWDNAMFLMLYFIHYTLQYCCCNWPWSHI